MVPKLRLLAILFNAIYYFIFTKGYIEQTETRLHRCTMVAVHCKLSCKNKGCNLQVVVFIVVFISCGRTSLACMAWLLHSLLELQHGPRGLIPLLLAALDMLCLCMPMSPDWHDRRVVILGNTELNLIVVNTEFVWDLESPGILLWHLDWKARSPRKFWKSVIPVKNKKCMADSKDI